MSPHVERMNAEWAELYERIAKLDAFLGTTIYAALDLIDQQLMHGQLGAMKGYGCILTQRLNRAESA